jgi:hypothetical protein
MSPEEMRNFCESIQPYQLQVKVRLKNGTDILIGKISSVSSDRFQLSCDGQDQQSLRYSWVARICAS